MICKGCLLSGFSNGKVVVFHLLASTLSFFRLLHFVLGNFLIYLKWICILVAVEQYRSSKVDELHFSVIR